MSATTTQPKIKKLRDDLAALHIRLSYCRKGLRREVEEGMILQEIKEVEEAIKFLEETCLHMGWFITGERVVCDQCGKILQDYTDQPKPTDLF